MKKKSSTNKDLLFIGVVITLVFCVGLPVVIFSLYAIGNILVKTPTLPNSLEPTVIPLPTQETEVQYTATPTLTNPPTPLNTPAASIERSSGNSQYLLDSASTFIQAENYSGAMPYLDQVILEDPENGDAYYYRARCYYQVSRNETYQGEYIYKISQAHEDIDKAILYGTTVGEPGDPYYLRYQILEGVLGYLDLNLDKQVVNELELENLRTATVLGSQEHPEQWIPLTLFALNRCEEGMDELQHAKEFYGLSVPPSASMLNIEAHGYVCLRQLDKALEYVDRGLAIESIPERRWFRAIILYLMGRDNDAMDELNKLIDAKPNFRGYRYYLRALIHYENGNRELAETDLAKGTINTWGRGDLRAYLIGQMALEDGDRETAIEQLQYALATMDWFFQPTSRKIEQQLAELGAQPLPDDPQLSMYYAATPMPELPPTPAVSVPLNAYGIPIPPNLITVNMATGSGPLQTDDAYPYPVYLFQPQEPVSIQSVQSLTINLNPSFGSSSDKFEVFLWEPKTGEWKMTRPGWESTTIENPERFVDTNGDIYTAIRSDYDVVLNIENFWVTINATGVDGSQIILDLQR